MSTDVDSVVDDVRPEEAERAMAAVKRHDLPSELVAVLREYETLEGARDRFLWRWVHKLAPRFTLPSVHSEYADRVRTDKTFATLFITLIDDVLEDRGDRATFEEASKVPFPSQTVIDDRPAVDREYVAFTERVWETLLDRLRDAPRFDAYLRTLRYDLKQAINAVEYSYMVIERPGLASLHELATYESHNMMMYPYADIDLMYSPPVDEGDLPELRKAVWCAQRMARIGNWVSTWERELREGDYSSGVLVYALQNGIVTEDERRALTDDPSEDLHDSIIERIHAYDIEEMFLERWTDRYGELVAADARIASIDLEPYIEGMREVLRYHLASRGLK